MPKLTIRLDGDLNIIINEPENISDADRAMIVVSAVMNAFQHSTTLEHLTQRNYFDFRIGNTTFRVSYEYRANRTMQVLEIYSATIKYIESNPDLFDPRLSQKATELLRRTLKEMIHPSRESNLDDNTNQIKHETFILIDLASSDIPELTPKYLNEVLYPYTNAVIELQHLIENIKGRNPSEVKIKEIKRNSPISVSLDGASEAIQVIKDTVVPWRRKHVETMARLIEQEKMIEIEAKKAEVVDKKIVAREQANKLKLENEKLRLELEKEKFQLAIEVLNKISNSQLTSTEREFFLKRLLPIIEVLGLGRLEMLDK